MDNVLRWDCVCDACDSAGRYHTVGQGQNSPPRRRPPSWLGILLLVLIVSVTIWLLLHPVVR